MLFERHELFGSRVGFSNSALAVTCHTQIWFRYHPLAGIEFQRTIERKPLKRHQEAGKPRREPGLIFFDRVSEKLNATHLKWCSDGGLKRHIPEFVTSMLMGAFTKCKRLPAVCFRKCGAACPETRTSCPLKIKRNERFESVNIGGLTDRRRLGARRRHNKSAVDAIRPLSEVCLIRQSYCGIIQ